MNDSIIIQNVDAGIANWLAAEAARRNISIEALSLELIRKGINEENTALQRREKIRELERQHAEGYARIPVQPDEFEIEESGQVWED